VTGVSLPVGVGLVCALLSALGTNLAFLFQAQGRARGSRCGYAPPLRSAIDLFRSKWWSIGWAVAGVAFALHVAALTLAPISIGRAVLAGGLVFLAVLAVFGDRLGDDPLVIGMRVAAFALILAGAGLIPAPARAGLALQESAEAPSPPAGSPESRTITDSHTAARDPGQRVTVDLG
jgi:hypothetical protein